MFYFSPPKIGEDSPFDSYFSNGGGSTTYQILYSLKNVAYYNLLPRQSSQQHSDRSRAPKPVVHRQHPPCLVDPLVETVPLMSMAGWCLVGKGLGDI